MLVRTVGLRISLLSLLCLCEGSALATDAASPPSSASFGTPPDPKVFVTLASQDNMTEVQLGELRLKLVSFASGNPHVWLDGTVVPGGMTVRAILPPNVLRAI